MDDLSEKELHKLASKRKQREELQTTKAVVHARRMTRRRIRRAKDRQDHYLFLKALAVTIQTVSVLLVCIMGISAYFELEPDSESTFYATQLSIELCVLIVVFAVIVFENMCESKKVEILLTT
ncbi:hypothetical protein Y032_0178g629 [Ancylostoma ceylanicum]|uniref:Uncharacterized protein n=1 Tax=Ancylostoma ceylanicum TaxID=53326 RepID=A0A016STQ7_9BILA|nr:hypothetical protein Y032_0178g629 [Ancylostoma ceylanicum]